MTLHRQGAGAGYLRRALAHTGWAPPFPLMSHTHGRNQSAMQYQQRIGVHLPSWTTRLEARRVATVAEAARRTHEHPTIRQRDGVRAARGFSLLDCYCKQ